jgi:hypothetical protein
VELAQEVRSEVVVQVVEEAAAEAVLSEAADNNKKITIHLRQRGVMVHPDSLFLFIYLPYLTG